MQISICFSSFICHNLFNLNAKGHPHPTKFRLTSFSAWLLANGQVLIKILLNFFFLRISLDKKKRGNRYTFGKKTSSKAVFLIFLLHNFFKDTLLLLSLYPPIISSIFCLPAARLAIDIFGEDNAEKNKRVDSETKVRGDADREDNWSTSAEIDGRTRIDNLGIKTNANVEIDKIAIAADNPDIATYDLDTVADNSDIVTDNSGIAVNNSGTAANDLGTKTDADIRTNDLSIVANNKAHAAFFFALHHSFFLFAFYPKLITASLLSSLPFLSSTTLWSKLILSYLVSLVNQRALSSRYTMDKMWIPSLNKLLSRMIAMVRLL